MIAAINFDSTGTTRIGRYLFNHGFMLPGLVTSLTACLSGKRMVQVMHALSGAPLGCELGMLT